ncbi:antibiotic biosynthesis monooxygenase [Pseudomonas sp. RP23018S]|nr:antibiotic biosynthesis monooxygenase [Pseudomonas sp. RP23018S]
MARPDSPRFTQLIEYCVAPVCQERLAHALLQGCQALRQAHQGLLEANVQASDDGRRVLQCLQWRSRAEGVTGAEFFSGTDFCQMLLQHRSSSVRFASYESLDVLCTPTAAQFCGESAFGACGA